MYTLPPWPSMGWAARPRLCSQMNTRTHSPWARWATARYHGSATTPAATSAVIGRIDQAVRRKWAGEKVRAAARLMRRDQDDGAASGGNVGKRMISRNNPTTAVGSTIPAGPLASTAKPISAYVSVATGHDGKNEPEAFSRGHGACGASANGS